jgi:hypothetical protein
MPTARGRVIDALFQKILGGPHPAGCGTHHHRIRCLAAARHGLVGGHARQLVGPGNGLLIEENPDLTDRQRRVVWCLKETQRPEMAPSCGKGCTGFTNT